ncbi:MAG: trypsin-like peptidase domain-containing protein [Alphaproteobacteria bacterium]|nr:MAG: trypsin-like peptidase domain-containing protein [Alphaproteobacteria bacterium]
MPGGIAGDRMSPDGLRGQWMPLAAALLLLGSSGAAEAACVDPSALSRSTASITRHLDASERAREPDVIGIQGTAWFLGPRLIVTAAHVARAMYLNERDWRDVEMRSGDTAVSIPLRVARFVGPRDDNIAVLEMAAPFHGAQTLPVRGDLLVADEPMISVAYPAERLRVASGRFVRYGTDGKLADAALLEMYDGSDRLVLDQGASGAPVVDCGGQVVAVVSSLIVQNLTMLSRSMRVSTAWQTPNVVSVPANGLKDIAKPE